MHRMWIQTPIMQVFQGWHQKGILLFFHLFKQTFFHQKALSINICESFSFHCLPIQLLKNKVNFDYVWNSFKKLNRRYLIPRMGCVFFKSGSDKISPEQTEFFSFKIKNISGKMIDFATLKDKKAIMIVNIACKCGYAKSNFNQMVEMYDELGPQGLEILAFPCDQFFGQELATPKQIKKHIEENYKAKFHIFQKIQVNGEDTHPLYAFLRFHSPLGNKQKMQMDVIPWNFSKFIVNSKGEVAKFFKPTDDFKDVKKAIEKLVISRVSIKKKTREQTKQVTMIKCNKTIK